MKKIPAVIFLLTLSAFPNLFAGLDYYHLNPAYINSPDPPVNRLRYLSINTDITNNSLKISDYNTHFNIDPIWEHSQKTTIFNLIPENGFQLNTDLNISPVQFYSNLFNISIYAQHFANTNLTKDIFDLALFGNELNRQYNFQQNQINSINYLGAALGVNYPIIRNTETFDNDSPIDFLKQLNIGGRFHYQKGMLVTQTDSSDGFVLTTPDAFLASVTMVQTFAQNANCFAFDIGAAAALPYNLTAGIALLNLNTGFNWQYPEARLFDIKIDSFSLGRLIEFESIDSFVLSVDSSYLIPSFKTSIPAQVLLRTTYQPIPLIRLALSYHQYLRPSRFINNFSRSINFNITLNPVWFFQTAISVTSDLKKNYRIGHSFDFMLEKYGVTLSADQHNGLFTNATGFNLGLSFFRKW
ncbi:MAG: hypothetical protein KGZ86_06360 [Candidatus Latescibacteria bacterium]|nr:hypothetical protein [Candidatus Latescibacterota bacterium]